MAPAKILAPALYFRAGIQARGKPREVRWFGDVVEHTPIPPV
jgi:hypothetical protein